MTNYEPSTSLVFILVVHSLWHMRKRRRLLLTSTNGSQVWALPSAASVISTSPPSSLPTLPCSDVTFALDQSTFTTTSGTLMSTTRLASVASTTDTALSAQLLTAVMSLPPCLISQPTKPSICWSANQVCIVWSAQLGPFFQVKMIDERTQSKEGTGLTDIGSGADVGLRLFLIHRAPTFAD